jgi:hypothetical protein
MNPAALVHFKPEMLSRYAQASLPATPCAAPRERKWAGVACIVVLALAPVLISLAT